MRWRRGFLALILGGLIGGCGSAPSSAPSSSHSSTAPTPVSTPASQSTTSALTPVKILSSVNQIGYTPVLLGIQQGIFRKYGLNAKVVQVGGAIVAQDAVVGGSAPFALTTGSGILLAQSKHVPLEAVVGMDVGIPFQLVVSNTLLQHAKLDAHSPLAQIANALAGKKFGVLGPTDDAYLDLFFKHFQITTHPVFIQMSSNAAFIPTLQKGLIAGFVTAPPVPEITEQKKAGSIVVSLRSIDNWGNALEDVLATSKAEIQHHPTLVQKTAEAVAASVQYAVAHPQKLIAFDSQHYHVSSILLKKGLPAFKWTPNGKMTPAMWAEAQRENVQAGRIPATVHATQGATWTNQFLKNGS